SRASASPMRPSASPRAPLTRRAASRPAEAAIFPVDHSLWPKPRGMPERSSSSLMQSSLCWIRAPLESRLLEAGERPGALRRAHLDVRLRAPLPLSRRSAVAVMEYTLPSPAGMQLVASGSRPLCAGLRDSLREVWGSVREGSLDD